MRAQIISGSRNVKAAKRSQKRLGRFRDWLTKGRRFRMIMRLDKSNPESWSFMTSAAFGHSISSDFAKDLGHRYFIPSTMRRDPDTYKVLEGQKPDVFLKAHIISKTMLQAEYAKRVYEVMHSTAFPTQVEKEAALKSIEVEYNGEKDANGKYTKNPEKYPIVSNPQLRNFAMAILIDEDKNKEAVYESAEIVTLNPSDKRVAKLETLADACRIDYLKEKNKNPDLEEPEFFEVYFVLPLNSEEKKVLGKEEPQEIDFRVYLANVDKDNYDRELKGLLEFLPKTYDELLMHCVDFQDYDENKFWSVLRLQVLINANDLKFVSDPDELEYIKKRADILTEILPEDSSPVLKEAMEEIRKEELLKKAREMSALEEESDDVTKSSDDEDEEQIVAKAKAPEEAPTPTPAPEATQPKSLEESLADSYVL